MGFGGISIWNLLIILAIIVLLFGTKKLRGIGSDLGSAIKGFRNSISDDESTTKKPEQITAQTTTETEQSTQSTTNKDKV